MPLSKASTSVKLFVLWMKESIPPRSFGRGSALSNGMPFFAQAFVGMEIKNRFKNYMARLKFHLKSRIGAISLPLTKNSDV